MSLQERVTSEYQSCMKVRDTFKMALYRFLIGELQRQPSKHLSDDQVITIFRKLKNGLSEDPKIAQENQALLELLDTFLPQLASSDEIRKWIVENIDFSKYKNKMQSMKDIMANFGKRADGNVVKKILEEL